MSLLQQTMKKDSDGEQGKYLRHAYLLLGPGQCGKSTLARAFAQALFCESDRAAPCGECRACRLMLQGNHPDFCLVQPLAKDGGVDRVDGTLRVEQAADILRDVATRPREGRYKFFLIQDFHRAHPSFANKLLKTLEEPPPAVILCLTATDRSSVLATIASRCQILELRPLEPSVVAQSLQRQWGAGEAEAEVLARLSGGRLGWAVQRLQQPDGLEQRRDAVDALLRLVEEDPVGRLAFAEALAGVGKGEAIFELIELWTTWWRDVLLVQAGSEGACINIDRLADLKLVASRLPQQAVQSYLRTLKRIEGYLHHTVNIRLALDVLLLEMPTPAEVRRAP